MPLDTHAASAISFANPSPALARRYEEIPSAPLLATALFKSTTARLFAAEFAIDQLGRMSPDWDGYGALPLAAETIQNAKATLPYVQRSSPIPDITPNPNGTLSFEWENERGVAHLEIGRTRISFYLKPSTGAPIFGQANIEGLPTLCLWIDQLVLNYLYPSQMHTVVVTQIDLRRHARAAV